MSRTWSPRSLRDLQMACWSSPSCASEHVLDVACGTGIVARLAWPQVAPSGRVVGLEVNAAMLDVARRVGEREHTPIEWQEGDATSLPIADGTFDIVLCQHGLQYFSERHTALTEMHRVLRPPRDGRRSSCPTGTRFGLLWLARPSTMWWSIWTYAWCGSLRQKRWSAS
jgi:ubiquinone/menaquinone biosynthesis C-methylase UbiE